MSIFDHGRQDVELQGSLRIQRLIPNIGGFTKTLQYETMHFLPEGFIMNMLLLKGGSRPLLLKVLYRTSS